MHEIIKWKEDTNFHYQDNRQQSFTKDCTGLVTIEIKQMEAVVFLFILDKFNSSLPSTPFQLLIIILSYNSQIIFLSYKDQHPLAPKPSKILYTRIHPRIKRWEGAAFKSRGRERETERERERREGAASKSRGRERERESERERERRGGVAARVTGGDNFFYL